MLFGRGGCGYSVGERKKRRTGRRGEPDPDPPCANSNRSLATPSMPLAKAERYCLNEPSEAEGILSTSWRSMLPIRQRSSFCCSRSPISSGNPLTPTNGHATRSPYSRANTTRPTTPGIIAERRAKAQLARAGADRAPACATGLPKPCATSNGQSGCARRAMTTPGCDGMPAPGSSTVTSSAPGGRGRSRNRNARVSGGRHLINGANERASEPRDRSAPSPAARECACRESRLQGYGGHRRSFSGVPRGEASDKIGGRNAPSAASDDCRAARDRNGPVRSANGQTAPPRPALGGDHWQAARRHRRRDDFSEGRQRRRRRVRHAWRGGHDVGFARLGRRDAGPHLQPEDEEGHRHQRARRRADWRHAGVLPAERHAAPA